MSLRYNKALDSMKPSASMAKGLIEQRVDYNLAVGSPDLPPPAQVQDIVKEYATQPLYNYQPTKGSKAALANALKLIEGTDSAIDPDKNLVLVPGAKYGIYMVLKTICDAGDNVVLVQPYWLSYPDICLSLNLNYSSWSYDFEQADYDIAALEKLLSQTNPKAIVLNNPVNPSGYIFSNETIQQIISLCAKHNIWVILDEVYKDLCFDRSLQLHKDFQADNLVRVGSFSKSLSIPGFRAGYVLGSDTFISKLLLLHQHIATSISALTNYTLEKIDAEIYQAYADMCAKTYSQRFEVAYRALAAKSLTPLQGNASFYMMVDVSSKFQNGEQACEEYQNNNILVTPGIHYGSDYDNYIRLCLTVNKDELKKVTELL